MTAKEWIFKKYPNAKEDWGKTGHDDNFQVKCMEEYANQRVIEELESFAYLVQGADEDIMSRYIDERVKELTKES